jgi:heme-binding NEAT domain protein
MGQEIHEASVMTNTLKEEQDRQIKQAVLRIDTFESQANRNDGWIKELQTAQMSLENDILLILRNYKEMLNEVLKVQMLSEDVKHLYAM